MCYLRTDCSEIELHHLRSHLVLTRVSCVHTEIRLYTTSAIHSCSFQLNLTPLQLLSLLSFAFLCASLWRFYFGYGHRCCHLGHIFADGKVLSDQVHSRLHSPLTTPTFCILRPALSATSLMYIPTESLNVDWRCIYIYTFVHSVHCTRLMSLISF